MSNVNELKEMAAGAALSAAKAAKYAARNAKIRMEIAMEQDKIRRAYAKLGKLYYKDYVTDEEPDEAEYKPLCENISACFRAINMLKEDLEDLKDEYYEAATQPELPEESEAAEEAPAPEAEE